MPSMSTLRGGNRPSGPKLCSINICGMSNRSKMMLDKYIDLNKLDIVAVQESGTSNKERLTLTNMKMITDTNNASNRGAVLYVHKSISCTSVPEISNVSKQIDSAWGLVIMNRRRYIIGSVYVKLNYNNGITDVLNMLNAAEMYREKVNAAGVILTGDFNARHTLWGDTAKNTYGNQLFDRLDSNAFTIQHAPSPTFLCENGSSCIDLIIISNNLTHQIHSCYTDDEVELFSGAPTRGHVPLLAELPHNMQVETRREEKLDIESIDWEKWSKEIESTICRSDEVTNLQNPKDIWSFLEAAIHNATSKHGNTKRTTRHSKPYWTDKLTELCNNARKARRIYYIRNTDSNLDDMNASKELFDMERKKACEDFILEKTKKLNVSESVEFWKRFNKLFKSKTDKGVDPLKDEVQGVVTENLEIGEKLFSTFFESKHLTVGNFDDHFYEEVVHMYNELKGEDSDENDETQVELNGNVTLKEITSAIKKTKQCNKSLDNHCMHQKMLHNLGQNALNLMEKLFNRCMDTAEWVWNTAEVIFLKKEGKASYAVPGSYRPISITSYIGKLLEKVLAERIKVFLERRGILDANQEGFTVNRNTVRYLNRLNIEIKTSLLKNNTVIALFIDFEKAFDSVWKKGLLVKLAKLNIKGKVLKLVDHFLAARKVQLNVNGETGELKDCNEYGLPQGSALSPILFKIYLLDILEELNGRDDISILKFADDGTVVVRSETTEQCIRTLKEVMKSLENWTRRNRMIINCQQDKTEYICFGTAERNTHAIPDTMNLGDKEIKRVTKTKVLGLTIDENLTYIPHSENVLKRITGKWAKVCGHINIHWGFNQRVITQIAKTFLLTSLNYAGHIWITNQNIKDIEKLWYKVVKAAVGATFNTRKSVAEIIVGIPPISIQNNINQTKHILKLNIKPAQEDKLRDLIGNSLINRNATEIPTDLSLAMKDVYKFLTWKIAKVPNDFTNRDKEIVEQRNVQEYFQLTEKACKYTKDLINKYTEQIWSTRVRNEFLLDGIHHVPTPSCSRLPIPRHTSRREEVLLMSLFYPNNLFNSNLYRNTYLVESPLCRKCHQAEETPYHIIFECSDKSDDARTLLEQELGEDELQLEDTVTLLNGSRHQRFLTLCLDILAEQTYTEHVDL